MCCPGKQPCEARFLYSRQCCWCLSSSLGALSPGRAAGSPPDSHCVTFVLSSTKVTPKVLVHPVTQTQLPMPELSTTLLQNRNDCCVSISYHTSSTRDPLCHQGKPKPVGSPRKNPVYRADLHSKYEVGTCAQLPVQTRWLGCPGVGGSCLHSCVTAVCFGC